MNDEYVSNPRLALLAEELRILNDELIKQGLPDNARIVRMRDFARTAYHISGDALTFSHVFDDLPTGITLSESGRLRAYVKVKRDGSRRRFSKTCTSLDEAIAAREALVAQHITGAHAQ